MKNRGIDPNSTEARQAELRRFNGRVLIFSAGMIALMLIIMWKV